MTVAVDDHNLKSLEKDDQTHKCENNGHLSVQVELERRPDDVELPVVFSSKGTLILFVNLSTTLMIYFI